MEPQNDPMDWPDAAGGLNAANLKVAQPYIGAFGNLAKTGNTLIVPSNLSDLATLVSSAMTIVGGAKPGAAPPAPKQA